MLCPMDGVGRVQRVWEGWDREGDGRARGKARRGEREREAGAEARTGVYR